MVASEPAAVKEPKQNMPNAQPARPNEKWEMKNSYKEKLILALTYFSSSRPGRPPKRASGVGLSLAATQFPGHPFKKHRLENGDYSPYENGHMSEMARMDKSPLLANGYNAPPTHLGPMGFMHQHALMSPGMPHPGVPRPDGSIIKGQPMHNMEALARSGIWENCRAAYEDIVKHLER
ncbi:jg3466 [Pararge aegeria aegeria]|uniref:Jg3466 protein n=1 Tax=Pararge aegeria aegeria TaxID=348720 RepID=A0A8S4RA59_9NEOP|nr:jg3466 [Pararge aegeria aegeria]